jgi:hypothetical protein
LGADLLVSEAIEDQSLEAKSLKAEREVSKFGNIKVIHR